jgi:membrane protease YdiL (CAAX protease family)
MEARPAGPQGGTLAFFGIAWALCAASLAPAILAQLGVLPGPAEAYMALAPIAVASPTLAAMLVSRFEPGGAGALAVFRGLRDRSADPLWYAIAFLITPLALVAGVAVYRACGGAGEVAWFYPPLTPDRIAALFIVPLAEEIGWRGFALPRLNARYGLLPASLVLGLGWGVWHLPMFLAVGVLDPVLLAAMVLFFLPGSVVFSWVYARGRFALPVAVVAHMGAHASNPTLPLPANPVPFAIHFAAIAVLAVGVCVADRAIWRR